MPDQPIVLLTNAMHPDGEAILAPHVRMIVPPDAKAETLREWAKNADGIIVRAKLPDDIVDHAPRLKGIVRHGVGLDFIPVAAATARGIAVANLPGSNTNAVAEYVMSALMHLRRPLYRLDGSLRSQGWNAARPMADSLPELAGSTLGILGVGTIGRHLAGIARNGFGMKVLGTSRRKGALPDDIEEVSLDDLFARSDAIAVCCALTDETRGMVSRTLIGRMRPTAILVNVSRGAVIETPALVEALRAQKIGGAALDVFDVQPLPANDALFDCPNLLLTPHTAGITATSGRAMAVSSAQEMLRILRGEQPLNLVNPAYKAA
ncbi:MAG: hydroxyacid dehydrogenase [Rhizobiales bacterium]|nr:hydroxyacid dehydrogenase [Hyphomicrobiales bacterium]